MQVGLKTRIEHAWSGADSCSVDRTGGTPTPR